MITWKKLIFMDLWFLHHKRCIYKLNILVEYSNFLLFMPSFFIAFLGLWGASPSLTPPWLFHQSCRVFSSQDVSSLIYVLENLMFQAKSCMVHAKLAFAWTKPVHAKDFLMYSPVYLCKRITRMSYFQLNLVEKYLIIILLR